MDKNAGNFYLADLISQHSILTSQAYLCVAALYKNYEAGHQ